MSSSKRKKEVLKVTERSKECLARFDDFQSLANAFFVTVGRRPYDTTILTSPQPKTMLEHFIFYGGLFNMNLVAILTIVLLILSFGESLMETIKMLTCIAIFIICDIKLLVITLNRNEINMLMHKLHEAFPKSLATQKQYDAKKYLKFVRRTTTIFSIGYLFIACTFSFYPLVQYLLHDFVLQIETKVGFELMFPMYVPWNWENYWLYGVTFLWQLYSSYTSVVGQVAVDLLFYAAATQLIMHYDYVARAIESYEVKAIRNDEKSEAGHKEDMKFLSEIVIHHNKILSLSQTLNKAFGVSLLMNFVCSCGTICFCAFFVTIDVGFEIRIKWGIITLGIVLQVYLITYFGQLLIDASTGIASAAFRQNWFNADRRYQNMLSIIIHRSQQPAFLTATSYVIVSQTTMTEIVEVTYKFLCVLQNIYSGKKNSK